MIVPQGVRRFRKKGVSIHYCLGCLIGTPLKVAGIHGMYGMYGCFISVGVSILGEDVIISFLVKHLDFSSLPSCLARSPSSPRCWRITRFSFTPLVFTHVYTPFQTNMTGWTDPPCSLFSFFHCDLSFLRGLEELFNERIVVWIPHHFDAARVTLLLCQK